MKKLSRILITGGAGFIGSHTADLLLSHGYDVTIIDNLEPQVHGSFHNNIPEYLNPKAKVVINTIRDKELLKKLLGECDAVLHLAALVGVGQSMYEPTRYIDTNTGGTAELLEQMITYGHNVEKVVVASSMSIYGEGKYECRSCGRHVHPGVRDEKALKARKWDHLCPSCSSPLESLPTSEDTDPRPMSIYALSKRHQEEMSLLMGETYGLPTVALRYFNVYGSRQSLMNPYTGACAIFSSRILSGNPPYIFEDGHQVRDFVHVKDVAWANLLALERNEANYQAINIGTGKPTSILELAQTLTRLCSSEIKPQISGEYRKGDIRHCYAETSRARNVMGFEASINLEEGLSELAKWARLKDWGRTDLFNQALQELREKRLISK